MTTIEEKIASSNFAGEAFLTRDQLCERLQIHKTTLKRWHLEGKAPPFVKIERIVRYPEKFLDRWLEKRLRDAENAA